MFGLGSDDKTPNGDLFDIDEIRHLVLEFPPPTATSSDENGLIRLLSGNGFTTKDALINAYEAFIKGRYGKIPLEVLEKQLDVRADVLFETLKQRDDFLLSKSKQHVFTGCDQERILQEIYGHARTKFVHAGVLADEHDIDVQSIVKFISLSEKSSEESPLQLLDAPSQSRAKSLELGNSYVHTLSTMLAVRKMVAERCKQAHTASTIAKFDGRDMRGLDVPSFAKLAYQFCQESNGIEPIYGFFESGEDEVRYVTKSYLLRKAKRILKEVAMGEEAYCDLEKLVKKYPTLLPNVEAAKQMAITECLHKDGSRYKWHFISHYAIGDVGLNNTAKRCMETLGPQRYLNTKPFIQVFPTAIQQDVLVLLQDRIVEFWRYCGGEVQEVIGINEWMLIKTMMRDMEFAAKRIGRLCADDAHKRQIPEPSLSSNDERALYLQKLHEESELPLELLERMWDDERVKIKSVGTASYSERTAELQAEVQGQLEATWKTRVYMPAQIHGASLDRLESGPLKDQLRDLLDVHLAQDLLPSTLKRLRTKGLLRIASSKKQVERLEAVLADKKKDVSIIKSLEKFHGKMAFSEVSSKDVAQAQEQQLSSMVAAMKDDTDAPRLFLTTILVLLATKKDIGVLYATGKFAPRLLKLLKADLDGKPYQKLERLKDAVKAGNVTEEDRTEMRQLAADSIRLETTETEPAPTED